MEERYPYRWPTIYPPVQQAKKNFRIPTSTWGTQLLISCRLPRRRHSMMRICVAGHRCGKKPYSLNTSPYSLGEVSLPTLGTHLLCYRVCIYKDLFLYSLAGHFSFLYPCFLSRYAQLSHSLIPSVLVFSTMSLRPILYLGYLLMKFVWRLFGCVGFTVLQFISSSNLKLFRLFSVVGLIIHI